MSLETGNAVIPKESFATLNRIVTFWSMVQFFAAAGEIDLELGKRLFYFNYNGRWNQYRPHFYEALENGHPLREMLQPVRFLEPKQAAA
jgi:hypothetical protein